LPQDGEADDVAENDKHEEVVQQAQAPILDLHDLHGSYSVLIIFGTKTTRKINAP
jgi:hypothetical protein